MKNGKVENSKSTETNRHPNISLPLVWGIIFIIIIFHTVNNAVVFTQDTVPFVHDPSTIYLDAVRVKTALASGHPGNIISRLFVESSSVYPPLFSAASAVFMLLFGTSQDIALMVNIPFLGALIILTYLLGEHLFNRETGILAALLLSFFPATFSLSRAYSVEFPLAAMVALSVYLLLRSKQFTSLKWSVLFGISVGLAALTSVTVSLFLLAPLFLVVVGVIRNARSGKNRGSEKLSLQNWGFHLLLSSLTATIVAIPWYIHHARTYIAEQRFWYGTVFATRWGGGYLDQLMANPPWLVFSRILLAPLALLFAAGLIYMILKKIQHGALLISWIIVPYILFLIIGMPGGLHMIRHLLPVLPAIAIIIAVSLSKATRGLSSFGRNGNTYGMYALASFILALGIASTLFITYQGGGELQDPFNRLDGNAGWLISLNYLGRTSPHDMGFQAMDIAQKILSETQSASLTVFVLNPHGMVSEAILTELEVAAEEDPSLSFNPTSCLVIDISGEAPGWLEQEDCMSTFASSDIAIIEEIHQEEFWVWNREMYVQDIAPIAAHLEGEVVQREVYAVLPNNLIAPESYVTIDPAFSWMNRLTYIVMKGNQDMGDAR